MARIVCVHGIGQQLKGPESLSMEWRAAIRDGMRLAGAVESDLPTNSSVSVAFFGDLFRTEITKGDDYRQVRAADVEDGYEIDLLASWVETGATLKGSEQPHKAGSAPQSVQWLVRTALGLPFFAGIVDSMLVGALKQVHIYFTDANRRAQARARLTDLIQADTELVIAHSLGSVVAYEALCQGDLPATPALITLGSPLGLRNLIFDRLDPAPAGKLGVWPAHAASWTNIADVSDVVASEKNLCQFFGDRVRDILISNEALAHDISPYFTSAKTGAAVLEALHVL